MRFLLILIFTANIKASYSEPLDATYPYYTAVSSREIHPFSNHNVTIFVKRTSTDNTVLTFKGSVTSQDNSEMYTTVPLDVTVGSSASLSIPVQSSLERPPYYFILEVTQEGNVIQNRSVILHAPTPSNPQILIQTDKPVYKTGDRVCFRVVSLDQDLHPVDDVNLTVGIRDAGGNVVKIWADQRPTKGLFKSELKLSIEPIIGTWEIKVTATKLSNKTSTISSANGNPKTKSKLRFQVDEYVLPKFEVKVNLPPFFLFSDTKIPVKVEAGYTHGRGINGLCRIRVSSGVPLLPVWNMTFDIVNGNGASDLEIQLDRERYSYLDLKFEAIAIEELTGIVRNGTSTLRVYRQPHKIDFISNNLAFKPGLPFNATFRITTHDGIPVMDRSDNSVRINWSISKIEYNRWHVHRSRNRGYSTSVESNGNIQESIGHDGRVQIKLSPPFVNDGLRRTLKVQLTYKKVTRSFSFNSGAPKSQLEIAVPSNVIPGEPFELYFWATEQVSSVSCVVIDRNSIVDSKQFNFKLAVSSSMIKIPAPEGLQPGARLIAYSVTANGELMTDEKPLNVERNLMGNFLNISAPDRIEPGATINLTLKSSPNSLVALRAVDHSILLLDYPDTDITAGRVKKLVEETKQRSSNELLVISNTKNRQGTVIPELHWSNVGARSAARGHIFLPKDGQGMDAAAESQPKYPALPKVRTKFLESWIWDEYPINENQTSIKVKATLPDTLTSWVITGFSLNNQKGIGVLEKPTKVITSRPFFSSMNLPFSVVKGETLGLQILIHNNMDLDLHATITIDNELSEFEFADEGIEAIAANATKTQYCKANSVTAVAFKIMPTKIGYVTLGATALTLVAGDALKKELHVKPRGKKVRVSELVLLQGGETVEIDLDFPDERVDGADQVKVMVIADMMGQVLDNLDKLLTMPTGCGEQNMMPFVVNIAVFGYLKSSGLLTDEVKSKGVHFLETGYQRELTYRHQDGSFSAFGKSDEHGSTWLTAFVVRSFLAGKPHTYINDEVIEFALKFLAQKQLEDGSFKEDGRVLGSYRHDGSTGAGVALTAYTTLTFLEAAEWWNSSQLVSTALEFIVNVTSAEETETEQDLYSLIVTTYTLHVANHSAKDAYFKRVMNLAITEENGFKYWDLKSEASGEVRPVTVEMTSYVLQTFLLRDQIADAYPIVRWLLNERNPEGGFMSTQDTIVGLTALAKFAQLTKSPVTDMTITVSDGVQERAIRIEDSDAMVLNRIDLPADTRTVTVSAQGNGTSLVSFNWEYYIENQISPFYLDNFQIEVKATENLGVLKTMTCVVYGGDEKSNVAIVELTMPTGFIIDQDFISAANLGPLYKRHDVEEGGAKVSIYFENFSLHEICFEIVALKEFQVSNPSPAYAVVYDYYDTTKMAEAFYVID